MSLSPPSSPPVCIYCESNSNPFDREHALQSAFGSYSGNDFVMHDLVCHPCNQHFGNTIDLALSRDSMEALLRLHYGVKPASRAKEIRYRRVTLRVHEPGPWQGAQFEFASDALGMTLIPEPLPQVGFRWKHQAESNWILEPDLSEVSVDPYRVAPPGSLEVKIIAPSATDNERLSRKLREFGLDVVFRGRIDFPVAQHGTLTAALEAAADSTIFRAIAKIAFNYVACIHGSEFIRRSDFDHLRRFIHGGKTPPWRPVVPTTEPILSLDSRSYRQTTGHLIAFDWNFSKSGLLAQVSLFNYVTYKVLFCPYYSGVWCGSIRSGHHFDYKDGTVSALASVSPLLIRTRYGIARAFHRP